MVNLDSIKNALYIQASSLVLPQDTKEDELYMAIRQVMRDNLDLFWFSYQWRYDLVKSTVYFHYPFAKDQKMKCITRSNRL